MLADQILRACLITDWIITVITVIILMPKHSLHFMSRTAEHLVYLKKAAESINLMSAENIPSCVEVKGHYTTIKSTQSPTNAYNKIYF